MINPTALEMITGWSIGYQYALTKYKEDEVKQGKNYYFSGLCQVGQLMYLGTIISRIAEKVLVGQAKKTTQILCNVVPILSIPIVMLMASVKQGTYTEFSTLWNKYIPLHLPAQLNERVSTIFKFFAEHGGNVMRVAMLAGTIGLLYLEDYAYAGAALSALVYEAVDRLGWVNRRISLFMEKYMYSVVTFGAIAGGNLLVRVINVVQLPAILSSSFRRFIRYKVDNLMHNQFKLPGHTLEKSDAAIVERRDISYEDMKKVLNAPPHSFNLIPAHCTKWVADLSKFPVDNDFTKLQPLFDEIDWTPHAGMIKSKLQDDDRFIDFLSEQFPEAKKADLKLDIQPYLEKLAEKGGVTTDAYAIEWTRKQMAILIRVLSGKDRVKGSQKHLDDGIQNVSKIIPYLLKLKSDYLKLKEENKVGEANHKYVELQDGLLKLAIEGGDYCGRQIKRSSEELVRTYVYSSLEHNDNHDPVKDYELKLKQALQDKRFRVVEQAYKAIADHLKQQYQVPGEMTQDIHGFDIYRTYLALGFVPLTQNEIDDLELAQVFGLAFYENFRTAMFAEYKEEELESTITDIGETEFVDYIRKLIQANSKLEDHEKISLEEIYSSANNGEWTIAETNQRFHRLMYVMLGILELK